MRIKYMVRSEAAGGARLCGRAALHLYYSHTVHTYLHCFWYVDVHHRPAHAVLHHVL